MWTREENLHESGKMRPARSHCAVVHCTGNSHSFWKAKVKVLPWPFLWSGENCRIIIFWTITISCSRGVMESSAITLEYGSKYFLKYRDSRPSYFWLVKKIRVNRGFETKWPHYRGRPILKPDNLCSLVCESKDIGEIYRHLPFVVATHRYYRHKATFFSLHSLAGQEDDDHWGNY